MNNRTHNQRFADQGKQSNFWFSFSLGAAMGAAGVYFFGTRKGRKNLEKALALTEDLEGTVRKVVGGVGKDFIDEMSGMKTENTNINAQTGKVTQEKDSFLHFLVKSIALYFGKERSNSKRFELKEGKVVH